MADDIIDKAYALMRRHRAFVAGDAIAAVPPAPTSAGGASEDIPVLTEVVMADRATVAPGGADLEAQLRERLAAALPQQRELLRRELAAWLDEQLPQVVLRVLDGVSDELIAQVNTQARTTLLPKLQALLDSLSEHTGGD
jgi:hypothetical protein